MKTVLQILQWYRPRDRWVLKSPQHLEQLGPLMTVFPDATIVVTHRDPVAVVQSTITMLTYAARNSYRSHTSPSGIATTGPIAIRRLLEASVRDRRLLPADRTVHVYFHEYMNDEMGTLQRVYDAAGIELTARARSEIERLSSGASPRQGGPGRLRPAPRLRRDARGSPRAVRLLLRPFPRPNRGPVNIQEQVDHLIDTRPGKELLTRGVRRSGVPDRRRADLPLRREHRVVHAADRHGRVIVNTGMGYEAPHHKRVFDAIRPGPTSHIITTQAHVDHVGGVELFREPGTVYVAQANNPACQADDKRIQGLRMRTAGIWFDMLGTDARRISRQNPGVSMAQSEPTPDVTFDRRLGLDRRRVAHRAVRRGG